VHIYNCYSIGVAVVVIIKIIIIIISMLFVTYYMLDSIAATVVDITKHSVYQIILSNINCDSYSWIFVGMKKRREKEWHKIE